MNTEGEKEGFNELKYALRKVSVYILHKWDVVFCQLEIDGEGIENEDKFPRLSERIFQRLCCWCIDSGHIATRKRALLSALIECGAKRAAEEMERYLIEKANSKEEIAKHEIRTRIRRKQKDSHSRRTGFQQKKGSTKHTKKRSKSFHLSTSSEKCEIPLKIDVKEIRQIDGQTGNKRSFQKMCLDFFSHILKYETLHTKLLQGLLDSTSLSVARLMPNNLFIYLKCPTIGAFSALGELVRTGRICAICQTALVTQKVLEAVGASRISLTVFVEPDVMLRARKILVSRKCPEPTTLGPKNHLYATEVELMANSVFPPNTYDMTETSTDKWLDDVCSRSNQLRHQYEEFCASMTDFLRILHISNPISGGDYTSLSDVIRCNKHNMSKGTSVNDENSKLVNDYIFIVNDVRIIVGQSRGFYLKLLETGILNDASLFEIEWAIGDISSMLEPTYKFQPDESVHDRELTPLERTCSGLVSYVPSLLKKLSELLIKLDCNIL